MSAPPSSLLSDQLLPLYEIDLISFQLWSCQLKSSLQKWLPSYTILYFIYQTGRWFQFHKEKRLTLLAWRLYNEICSCSNILIQKGWIDLAFVLLLLIFSKSGQLSFLLNVLTPLTWLCSSAVPEVGEETETESPLCCCPALLLVESIFELRREFQTRVTRLKGN